MADWETQLIDGHEPFVNGLDNPTGSTCYVNSVLQAIFSMKNLVLTLGNEEVVQDVRELVSFNTENEYKLFRWFSILIERCWENGEADGIYKKFMKACFKSCQDRFLPNQQEDSCEFLLFMLEDIGNTFNDLIAYFNNEPVLTFGFEAEFFPTIRKITIYECQHQSMREERELLVVYPSNKGILTDCIKDSIRPVYFDPCECKDGIHDPASRCQALLCSECNEYVSGVIHQKVIRFPSTLLVNIRLFEATQERTKDLQKFELSLDLSGLRSEDPNCKYDLSAVVFHRGDDTRSGHYTCLRKHFDNNVWCFYNDNRVKRIEAPIDFINKLRRDKEMHPYILVYKKEETLSVTTLPRELSRMSLKEMACSDENESDGLTMEDFMNLDETVNKSKAVKRSKMSSSDSFYSKDGKIDDLIPTSHTKIRKDMTPRAHDDGPFLQPPAINDKSNSAIAITRSKGKLVIPPSGIVLLPNLDETTTSNTDTDECSSTISTVSDYNWLLTAEYRNLTDAEKMARKNLQKKLSNQRKRADPLTKEKERIENAARMRKMRTNNLEKAKKDQDLNSIRRSQSRIKDPIKKERDQAIDTVRRSSARASNPEKTQADKTFNTSRRSDARAHNPEKNQADQIINTARRSDARATNPEKSQADQIINTARRSDARATNTEKSQADQIINTARRSCARANNPEKREIDQQKNSSMRREKRLANPDKSKADQVFDTVRRKAKRESLITAIIKYEDAIKEGPIYVCVCCGGTWFRRSVVEYKPETDLQKQCGYVTGKKTDDKEWICVTCNRYLKKDLIPRMFLGNGFAFHSVPKELKQLNDVEERLCAPRIAYLRIRSLGYDEQSGLRGNLVNVEFDLNQTTELIMPRPLEKEHSVYLKLMRQSHYNNPYRAGIVSPEKVRNAIARLEKLPLYKKLNIKLSTSWIKDDLAFDKAIDEYRAPKEYQVKSKSQVTRENCIESTSESESENATSNESSDYEDYYTGRYKPDNVQVHDTLLLDCNKNAISERLPNTLPPPTIMETVCRAPSEMNRPRPIIADPYSEEATFIKIFGGDVRPPSRDKQTFTAVCKSYLRRHDRRCAEDLTYIFYMYKKLMNHKLCSAINMSLKSTRAGDLTVKDVLENNPKLADYLRTDDAKKFLRTIRSSPEYWVAKKKDLFAMLRQLGCPTFFITLSPDEIRWIPLLVMLKWILDQVHISEAEAEQLDQTERVGLLKRDPVTTARYFENRIRSLLTYIHNKKVGPFCDNEIIDYFWRIEFQARGSPHMHMLIWCGDVPRYDRAQPHSENTAKCIDLIDKYITTEAPKDYKLYDDQHYFKNSKGEEKKSNKDESDDESTDEIFDKTVNINLQRHHCRSNCLVENENLKRVVELDGDNECSFEIFKPRKGFRLCKYGFPQPILNETHILEPFDKDSRRNLTKSFVDSYRRFMEIKNFLHNHSKELKKRYKNNKHVVPFMTQQDIMIELNMTEVEYIEALRSSIIRTTVFLMRTSEDICINPYNKQILLRHNANMDIQYVTDSYAVVIYICAYLMKGNATMSALLQQAVKELEKGNMKPRQQLYFLAQKFQNCAEISAQECVYHLLSMTLSHSSRANIFVLTWPVAERFSMIKTPEILKTMPVESHAILVTSLLDHYAVRPKSLDKLCLAEFASTYDYFSKTQLKKMYNSNFKSCLDDDIEDQIDEDDYDHLNDENIDVNSDDDNDEDMERKKAEELKQYLLLGDKSGYVKERKRAKIVRYRRYDIQKNRQEFFREQILLFSAWRNELSEIQDVNDKFEQFQFKKDEIIENRQKFEKLFYDQGNYDRNIDQYVQFEQECNEYLQEYVQERARELNMADEHQMAMLRAQLEAENTVGNLFNTDHLDNVVNVAPEMPTLRQEEMENEYGYAAEFVEVRQPQVVSDLPDSEEHEINANGLRMNDDEYNEMMATLNEEQQLYLMNVLNRIKNGTVFHDFVTGAAGVGKSRLIKAVSQTVNRFLLEKNLGTIVENVSFDSNTHVLTLLCAYTGKASFNIRGNTIHSAFGIPLRGEFGALSHDSKIIKTRKYHFLRLVIIDEISLVGSKFFAKIDKRLRQITGVNEFFGNVCVIVMGDFNQLQPLYDNWVFCSAAQQKDHMRVIEKYTLSEAWRLFRIFTLKTIMRVANDLPFTKALTVIGEVGRIGLTAEQVRIFDNRVVAKKDIPQEVMFLFMSNENVNKHNDMKINSLPGELIEQYAVHTLLGTESVERINEMHRLGASVDKNYVQMLPYKLRLKVNVKYMVVNNVNICDGIVNGTCGILRRIDLCEDIIRHNRGVVARNEANRVTRQTVEPEKPKPNQAYLLWLDFQDSSVGNQMRRQYAEKINFYNPEIDYENWTPIGMQKATCTVQVADKWSFTRRQFPLVECEALTIFKSQGQSFANVAVDLNEHLKKSDFYVAISRVTSQNGLYLYGKKGIQDGGKYLTWDAEQRKKYIKQEANKSIAKQEMKRLINEASFINTFPFLNIKQDSELALNRQNSASIVLHNCDGLIQNIRHIRNDFAFKKADILILTATNLDPNFDHANDINIASHQLIECIGKLGQQSSHGICIYQRIGSEDKLRGLRLVANNLQDQRQTLQISLFCIKSTTEDFYVCCVYNAPARNGVLSKNWMAEVKLFLRKNLRSNKNKALIERVLLLADIGYSLDKTALQLINDSLGIRYQLKRDSNETLGCLTNVNNENEKIMSLSEYESYFSKHKPIWLYIKN